MLLLEPAGLGVAAEKRERKMFIAVMVLLLREVWCIM
jgi:hypothetical protein